MESIIDIENWTFKKFCKFGLAIFIPILIPIIISAFLISLITIEWLKIVSCITVAFLICYFYLKYWLIKKVINNDKMINWIKK